MERVGNVSFQVESIKDGEVTVLETFDLTNPNGPGVLVRAGNIVDCAGAGIMTATRRLKMNEEQAVQLGIPLLPHKLRETVDRLDLSFRESAEHL